LRSVSNHEAPFRFLGPHPSRRGEDAAPQDEGWKGRASLRDSTTHPTTYTLIKTQRRWRLVLTDRIAQTPRLPLEGVKVIDIASFLAAPIGAMFLADFGA
jgi:CoA-transferase family III